MFQCGSLTSWLIIKLHKKAQEKSISLFDVGSFANICSPQILFKQNWGRVYQPQVFFYLMRYLENAPKAKSTIDRCESYDEWRTGRAVTPSDFSKILTRSNDLWLIDRYSKSGGENVVRHVENKVIDFQRLEQILLRSKKVNHWANFGPVSIALQECVSSIKKIASHNECLMTASGTAATLAVVGALNSIENRKLKWVVSSFGFMSSHIGPLAGSIVIDCDSNGMLCQDSLMEIDERSYDGVLITNPFGSLVAPVKLIEWIKSKGKRVIYDNAQGLFDCSTINCDLDGEIISFHQTKPWGVGEGGCVIASRKIIEEARKLINFGVGSKTGSKWSFNGKISDVACAAILDRLERHSEWVTLYKMQERRISSILERFGFVLLNPVNGFPRNSVPVLSVEKIRLTSRKTWLRKYYIPLKNTPTANDIYQRILNVPSHPGMKNLSESEIVEHISQFTTAAHPHSADGNQQPAFG